MIRNIFNDVFVFLFMFFTRIVVTSYTYLTLPLYYWTQKPWNRLSIAAECGAQQVDPSDPSSEWVRHVDIPFHPLMECETAAEAFLKVLELYPLDRPSLGYREVLAEEIQVDRDGKPIKIDGKVLRKYRLSDYKWLTLGEVGQRVDDIAQGLVATGLKSGDHVAIYAETGVQWFLTSTAVTKMGAILVTVFHTLSDEGLIHSLNETEVTYLITSFELMSRVSALSDRLPTVQTVVYFEGPKKEIKYSLRQSVKVLSLTQLETIGQKIEPKFQFKSLAPEDVCLIMYTSGTSGLPKGVIGTQRQLKEAAMAMGQVVRDVIMDGPNHTYIAYLPQAHILEATIELFLFLGGVKIGFATPFTLNESAPGLAEGTVCDLRLLKPTIMTTVPLVLDRIRKEMYAKLKARTPVSTDIFNYLIEYKSQWIQKGYSTPIVNHLLCGKVKQQLGGRVQYMVVGSAPLSPQLQALIRCSADVTLIHGYGTTETCGGVYSLINKNHIIPYNRAIAENRCKVRLGMVPVYPGVSRHVGRHYKALFEEITNLSFTDMSAIALECVLATDFNDLSYGRVGAPLNGVKIKIIDWEEGGYSYRDKPHPRGEIVVGGKMVSNGYFKLDALNKQDFYVDSNGLNWFRTGDIAEIHSNGTVEIIDRKRDLIKLANGEFISLGKIEAALKNDPFVDNVCVVGNAIVNHLVALIQPNPKSLASLCKELQISDSTPYDQICSNAGVVKQIHTSIVKTGLKQQLHRKEIPSLITVCYQEWTPDNGCLTAAMKLKRNAIAVRHRTDIEDMFRFIKCQNKENSNIESI